MANILVIEDEPAIMELVAFACSANGHTVRRAESATKARYAIAESLPDLLILDWMLPDRSGIDLLRELRAEERTRGLPVIMLTAKGGESDRVTGLDAGADDYVVKPFSPRELMSRVRAVIRRRAPEKGADTVVYGELSIDPDRHEATLAGVSIKLGPTEYKLLAFLAGQPERVFSRAQLLDRVWGDHVFLEERTIDVHMLRLRKALADVGARDWVQTVRGIGYRLSSRAEP